jgi:hypothetical protein
MRFSSVEAHFEAPPRLSLASNLSQLGIGRRANKKPRLIAGRGCVGSDTKLLCMRFCCRTGSTPRHPNTLSLSRYEHKDDSAGCVFLGQRMLKRQSDHAAGEHDRRDAKRNGRRGHASLPPFFRVQLGAP